MYEYTARRTVVLEKLFVLMGTNEVLFDGAE
jgi:hypothetical protein